MLIAALLPWLSACGGGLADTGAADMWTADGASPPETSADTGTDARDTRQETRPVFDLTADLTVPATFFHQPWPSDSRLLDGRPDLRGLPLPVSPELGRAFRDVAAERRGHSQLAVAWFRMTAPLAPLTLGTPNQDWRESPIMLLDVDSRSPELGRIIPVIAETLGSDDYTPSNLLAVSPRPGIVLAPNTRYAVLVRRSVLDAAGEPIGVADNVASLLAGDVPPGAEALAPHFAALTEALATLKVPLDDIATATVFTTGDSAADFRALSDALLAAHTTEIVDLTVDPFDGANHDRFCELHGTVSLPQFQGGLPPFDTGGTFATGEGIPKKFRDEQSPVVLTLPNAPMPADGFPLVVYLHGPEGRATDVVDRGVVFSMGGTPKRGEGPAWVLSPQGFAALSVALPLSPQRLPGAAPRALLGTVNPAAIRDHLRQAVIEARLVIDAAGRLTIPPETVGPCKALSSAESTYRINSDAIYVLGDRTGGMVGTLLTALEPAVRGLVTGSAGGFIVRMATHGFADRPEARLTASRWGLDELPSELHPALHVAQLALEAADPAVFAARIGWQPLPGMGPRSLLQVIGNRDGTAPIDVLDAMAAATKHSQAGDVIWPSLSDALAWVGVYGPLPYPVSSNMKGADWQTYTSAVVQVAPETGAGDPLPDASAILTQLDGLKFQYACFFRSHRDTGVAAIVAPQPLGESCPEFTR